MKYPKLNIDKINSLHPNKWIVLDMVERDHKDKIISGIPLDTFDNPRDAAIYVMELNLERFGSRSCMSFSLSTTIHDNSDHNKFVKRLDDKIVVRVCYNCGWVSSPLSLIASATLLHICNKSNSAKIPKILKRIYYGIKSTLLYKQKTLVIKRFGDKKVHR